nr:hypothetical protein Q903MT_gene5232 [Picea sitchensis]
MFPWHLLSYGTNDMILRLVQMNKGLGSHPHTHIGQKGSPHPAIVRYSHPSYDRCYL